jgi:hypothetical protein
VPDLPKTRKVAYGVNDIMRRFSLRFIDHKGAVKRRRLRLAWHLAPVPGTKKTKMTVSRPPLQGLQRP